MRPPRSNDFDINLTPPFLRSLPPQCRHHSAVSTVPSPQCRAALSTSRCSRFRADWRIIFYLAYYILYFIRRFVVSKLQPRPLAQSQHPRRIAHSAAPPLPPRLFFGPYVHRQLSFSVPIKTHPCVMCPNCGLGCRPPDARSWRPCGPSRPRLGTRSQPRYS